MCVLGVEVWWVGFQWESMGASIGGFYANGDGQLSSS